MSELQLSYTFESDPERIVVSEAGVDPNLVTLSVYITNPHDTPVIVDKIDINIPIGFNTDKTLSAQNSFQELTYDRDAPWQINTNGSVITIQSNTNSPLSIYEESIYFVLPNIVVNEKIGTVNITITELPSEGDKIIDNTTYTLVKHEPNYAVTSFYADPHLIGAGTTTTLYWQCTMFGRNCYYKLYTEKWNTGDKLTWNDGEAGVVSPILYRTSNVYLDVYQEQPEGSPILLDTLLTDVLVTGPQLFDTACDLHTDGIDRLVTLFWRAENATYCQIQINDQTYVDQAPLNTDPDGYQLLLNQNDTAQSVTNIKIVVLAFNEDGSASDPYRVDLTINTMTTTEMDTPAPPATAADVLNGYGIAIDTSGTFALIMGYRNSSDKYIPCLNKISLPSLKNLPTVDLATFLTLMRISNVAITMDNKYAYTIVNGNTNSSNYSNVTGFIKRIDLNKNTVETFNTVRGQVGVSLAKSDQILLSACSPSPQAQPAQSPGIIYASTNKLTTTNLISSNQACPCFTAITRDGQYAYIANKDSNSVSILNLNTMQVESNLTVGNSPISISFTLDGTLALVANSGSNNISIIQVASKTVEVNTIAVGSTPYSIAITSDNQYAYVANKGSNDISLINIPKRIVVNKTLTCDAPVALALTPNQQLLVVKENSASLMVINNPKNSS